MKEAGPAPAATTATDEPSPPPPPPAPHVVATSKRSSSSGVGGASLLQAAPRSGESTTTSNFEYEDSEWDVGIGNLIIDLDADIEKSATSPPRTTSKPPPGTAASATTAPSMPSGTSPPSPPTSSSPANVASSAAAKNGTAAAASSATATSKVPAAPAETSGLKMKIKRTKPSPGTRSTEPKHEIVKTTADGVPVSMVTSAPPAAGAPLPVVLNNNNNNNSSSGGGNASSLMTGHNSSPAANKRAPPANHNKRDKSKEAKKVGAAPVVAPVVRPPIGAVPASPVNGANGAAAAAAAAAAVAALAGAKNGNESPPAKKWRAAGHLGPDKVPDPSPPPPSVQAANNMRPVQQMAPVSAAIVNGVAHVSSGAMTTTTTEPMGAVSRADASVGTCSASTMTEPECLGPCEPGTAVTLEGIVWHETEGGVLVVNVTWRGKTYVGTLMDCTKNDWAPPRFCDSPTSDAESRAPKGRAKRGRAATGTPIPATPLADSSPMHGKLRAKGRRNGPLPAPPSPAKELPNKRKSSVPEPTAAAAAAAAASQNKRSRSNSRGASSPSVEQQQQQQPAASATALIECPEPNCSKKYRHINGLKYHQSHAHSNSEFDEDDLKMAAESAKKDDKMAPDVARDEQPVAEHVFVPIEPPAKDGEPAAAKKTSPAPPSSEPVAPAAVKVPPLGAPLAAADAGREDVQSPAYSDISDDQSPIDTASLLVEAKEKLPDTGALPFLGGYPYFGQPFAAAAAAVPPDQQQQQQQPQPPPVAPLVKAEADDKATVMMNAEPKAEAPDEQRCKEEKPVALTKSEAVTLMKEEKKEEKPQAQGPNPQAVAFELRQQEDLRRFYSVYEEHPSAIYQPMASPNGGWARKPPPPQQHQQQQPPMQQMQPMPPQGKVGGAPVQRPPSVDNKPKDVGPKPGDGGGVKPTMETQGPPPPPPTQGLYGMYSSPLYPYGLPFDPSHPAYRNHFGSPFGQPQGGGPFGLPPQMAPQRYPSFPQDEMNRAHALEMLQQQASQYYAALAPPPNPGPAPGQQQHGPPPPQQQQSQAGANHKIHELTERALKSPPASPAVGGASKAGGAPQSSVRGPQSGGGVGPGGYPQYPPSSAFGGPKPLLRP